MRSILRIYAVGFLLLAGLLWFDWLLLLVPFSPLFLVGFVFAVGFAIKRFWREKSSRARLTGLIPLAIVLAGTVMLFLPPAFREIKLKSPKNGVKLVSTSTNGQNSAEPKNSSAETSDDYSSRLFSSSRKSSSPIVTIPFSSRRILMFSRTRMIFLKESLNRRNGRFSCASFSGVLMEKADWI